MGSKFKNFGLIGLGMVAGVAVSMQFSAVAQKTPGNFLPVEELRQLTEVFGIIKNEYVEPVEDNKLLTEVKTRGYPHLVRVWNYFANINHLEKGLERYRHFCIGRFNAFAAQGIAEEQFPSACALGHSGGDLLIYALATKVPAQHFENPQQAAAYHYPREYGPRSPSFARASLLELASHAPKLFVSGTASVVGFVTQHPDNLDLQIKVTLENLACLLTYICTEYSKNHEGIMPNCTAEVIKIYVRNPQDLPEIKRQITSAYPTAPVVYLAAEICRADLLLEVDGIWNLVC